MDSRFRLTVLALTSVALLGACAGQPQAKGDATAAPVAKRMSGYTARKRGNDVVYCKKELVTGSRTNATETCMTEDEMERARRADLDLLRRLDQNGGTAKGATNAQGGAVMDVMHP